ncbi:MAG: hypothetical protein MHPSP_001020 [Paramarteilia canceri]
MPDKNTKDRFSELVNTNIVDLIVSLGEENDLGDIFKNISKKSFFSVFEDKNGLGIKDPFFDRTFSFTTTDNKTRDVQNIWLKDWNDTNLPEINKFFTLQQFMITDGIKDKKNILVHCKAGKDRTAAFIIAFIILKYQKKREYIYDIVKKMNEERGILVKSTVFLLLKF